MKMSHS